LKKRSERFGRFSLKLGIYFGLLTLVLQLFSADSTAKGVAKNQPIKFAAMEGIYKTKEYTAITVAGYVDAEKQKVVGLEIPGGLSLLTYGDAKKAVPGLNEFPKQNWPNVPFVFQTYHIMVAAWGLMLLVCILGVFALRGDRLRNSKIVLWILTASVLLPYAANTAGWFTAEIGRQPWLVYGILRTSEGVSKAIHEGQVVGSLVMFICIYAPLFSLFIFLLNRKIQHGPEDVDLDVMYQKQIFSTAKGKTL
jgi:cytochrome d ubiquinol oxidase subunit I